MRLPSESRWKWSLIAAAIVCVMIFGWLAACSSVGFIEKYPPLKLVRTIAETPRAEFDGRRIHARMRSQHVVTIVLPIVLWPLCLLRWRTRRSRVAAALVAWWVPCWWLFVYPPLIVAAPIVMFMAVTGQITGEEIEDGGLILLGSWLWWLFMLVVTVRSARKDSVPGQCASCGYSTVGLTTGVCPECGARGANASTL